MQKKLYNKSELLDRILLHGLRQGDKMDSLHFNEKQVKIKICGITEEKETEYLKKNNVDFAGIVVFYKKSRRCIDMEKAKGIISALGNIKSVAVTVAPTLEEIREIEAAGFDYIQIHKDLNREIIEKCSLPILKAFNISDLNSYSYYQGFDKIAGYVFDASVPGSGQTFDWNLLSSVSRDNKLFILAGGLTPENVRAAIEAVHPDVVDVSTGVEYEKKQGKDPKKVDIFCQNVFNIPIK